MFRGRLDPRAVLDVFHPYRMGLGLHFIGASLMNFPKISLWVLFGL